MIPSVTFPSHFGGPSEIYQGAAVVSFPGHKLCFGFVVGLKDSALLYATSILCTFTRQPIFLPMNGPMEQH